MDIAELKYIVRESLKKELKTLMNKKRRPPSSYSDFCILFEDAAHGLAKIDVDLLYEIWSNISEDMINVEEDSLVKEWNDLIVFYTDKLQLPEKFRSQIIKKLLK